MDHYGDGLWRLHDSPAKLNGGTDEPRKNPRCNNLNRHE